MVEQRATWHSATMAYRRGTQAPMELEPCARRSTCFTHTASVFDADRTQESQADESLMEIDTESAPHAAPPLFTPLPVGQSHAAIPGFVEGKETVHAPVRAPEPPALRVPSPAPSPPRAATPPKPRGLVLREGATRPSTHKDVARRSFSERTKDYWYGRHPSQGEPRPSLFDRPEVLLTYAQVIFNASILAVFLYLLFCLVYTVQRDVSQKVHEYEIGTSSVLTRIPRRNRCMHRRVRCEPLWHVTASARADRGVCNMATMLRA